MNLSDDDAIALAVKAGGSYLELIASAFGQRAAMAFASGLAGAARNWVASHQGSRCAYDLYQGLADDLVTREVVQ